MSVYINYSDLIRQLAEINHLLLTPTVDTSQYSGKSLGLKTFFTITLNQLKNSAGLLNYKSGSTAAGARNLI